MIRSKGRSELDRNVRYVCLKRETSAFLRGEIAGLETRLGDSMHWLATPHPTMNLVVRKVRRLGPFTMPFGCFSCAKLVS